MGFMLRYKSCIGLRSVIKIVLKKFKDGRLLKL